MLFAKLIPLIMFCATLSPIARGQTLPDFAKARDEAVQRLQELIRIDTSNPPGNETKVAEYLKAILDKEGIPSEIVALEPARGSLIARLKGNGKKKPLLLMAHTDVVGVERDKWRVDPFAGVIQDGYVYGRGATDDKDDVAAMLQAVLLLHRQKIPLDRDIIFLGAAGEEGGAPVGVLYLVGKHFPKIEAEFAINEGGTTDVRNGNVRYVAIQTAEKLPRGIRVVARGFPGHGSRPRMDNPVYRLAAAITRIAEYQPPMRLNETTRVFFQRMAGISSPEEARQFRLLEDPVEGPKVQETFRRSTNLSHLTYNSMLRDSISPNIIKGGFRFNVIPGEAEARLDVRLLPGQTREDLMAQLKRVIDDPSVELIPEDDASPMAPSSPSRLDEELFQALERAQKIVFPSAVTTPTMSTSATDSSHLRSRGIPVFGISPPATDESREGVHGNNERVSVEGMGQYVEFIYRAVVDVAAAK
ncbi:MAG: M20/M25/M40 family metallo-hydrolase [Acidobacteria bacterium]|nr:M20/M25/M40 family metallo-hydrolase [Acidobacteriota bacterium]